jgi:hypothetical protein
MSDPIAYSIDFGDSERGGRKRSVQILDERPIDKQDSRHVTSRIARLMALAIRFEGLVRSQTIEDYAELARLGKVTRARITQIMKLLLLAPDIQEQLLFLPPRQRLNERNLRSVVSRIDWSEQRRAFQKIVRGADDKLTKQ